MNAFRSRLASPTLLALALLILVPCTLAAETPAADAPTPTASPETVLCSAAGADAAIFDAEPLPLASLAQCTADCEDGTSVTCSGSSCSAQDQDCSQNQAGYCTAGLEEKFCEPCDNGDPEPVVCKSQGKQCVDNDDCPPCTNGDPCACFGGTCGCA